MYENLENSKIDEFFLVIKIRSKYDFNGEKVKSQCGVILKVSILEEKFKDVLIYRTLFFIFLQKYRFIDSLEMNDGCNFNR